MEQHTITMTVGDMFGNPFSPVDCPIARAVKRQFPNESVSCGFSYVRFYRKIKDGRDRRFSLPNEVLELQRKMLDKGLRPEPITFVMVEQAVWI